MKYPEVARRIREALSDNKMTAQDLVNASAVSKSSVSHYVNGLNCPTNVAAYKMASVLKVAPEWLMGFDVPKERTLVDSVFDSLMIESTKAVNVYRPMPSDMEEIYTLCQDENIRKNVLAYAKFLSAQKDGD